MKVIVLNQVNYDYSKIVGALLVPDDFDFNKSFAEYKKETFVPAKGKNQHGEWESKSCGVHTKTEIEWLQEKYESIEAIEWRIY
jgi:hypothetical protein